MSQRKQSNTYDERDIQHNFTQQGLIKTLEEFSDSFFNDKQHKGSTRKLMNLLQNLSEKELTQVYQKYFRNGYFTIRDVDRAISYINENIIPKSKGYSPKKKYSQTSNHQKKQTHEHHHDNSSKDIEILQLQQQLKQQGEIIEQLKQLVLLNQQSFGHSNVTNISQRKQTDTSYEDYTFNDFDDEHFDSTMSEDTDITFSQQQSTLSNSSKRSNETQKPKQQHSDKEKDTITKSKEIMTEKHNSNEKKTQQQSKEVIVIEDDKDINQSDFQLASTPPIDQRHRSLQEEEEKEKKERKRIGAYANRGISGEIFKERKKNLMQHLTFDTKLVKYNPPIFDVDQQAKQQITHKTQDTTED